MTEAAWAEVDLGAIRDNLTAIRQFVGESVDVMPVLKANAYGHGAAQVAAAARDAGIHWFGVATAGEAAELRETEPDSEICILSPCLREMAEVVAGSRATPLVSDMAFARALSEAAVKTECEQQIHLDLNTGMGRSGFSADELAAAAEQIGALPGIRVSGLATHFPSAESDPRFTRMQIDQVVGSAAQLGGNLRVHAANSAGLCGFPEGRLDMVRPGLLVYGILPGMPPQTPCPEVRPALSLRARISLIKTLPPGASVSYDRTCVLRRRSRVATIPIGYGDGYPRELSNRGKVLVAGKRAPILGRVCMDVTLVDVTDIPEAAEGHIVTLIGWDGHEQITANEIARMIRTTPHDVTTRLLPRVARVYLNEQKADPSLRSG